MNALRIGSLCTGYGGLDVAVQAVIGGEHAWMAENDPHASKVLAHHWPAVPNLGDITEGVVLDDDGEIAAAKLDEAGSIDVLVAGFPCTNISNAGPRDGINGKDSRIWKYVVRAVRVLRPGLVVLENVAAIRIRGLDTVAADLAAVGYDAVWTSVRACDSVGAPHERDRWFCLAVPDAQRGRWDRWARDLAEAHRRDEPADRRNQAPTARLALLPTPAVGNFNDGESLESWKARRDRNKAKGINGNGQGTPLAIAAQLLALGPERWVTVDGVDYGPAVRRWESVTGHPAPAPTVPGVAENHRLNQAFAEWMMGIAPGHVTAVPDVSRRHQIRIIGGGVVPRHGIAAIEALLAMLGELERRAAA